MQSDFQGSLSLSTIYRYKQANRQSDLKDFQKFKNEFERFLSEEDTLLLKKVYHHGIIGRNVNQHTVVIDKVGSIKISQISKILNDQQFVAYINQRMIFLSQKYIKEKQQIIWIIDLAGPIMQLASKRVYTVLQKILANLQKYFVGILHKLYFVNTPMLFDAVWNKICGEIAEETQEKIIFLTDELDQLYMDVDPVILPEFLGGNCSNKILEDLESQFIENSKEQKEQNQEEDEQIDFNQLKAALSGLKIGSKNHGSVAQTPLNTEADDYKK